VTAITRSCFSLLSFRTFPAFLFFFRCSPFFSLRRKAAPRSRRRSVDGGKLPSRVGADTSLKTHFSILGRNRKEAALTTVIINREIKANKQIGTQRQKPGIEHTRTRTHMHAHTHTSQITTRDLGRGQSRIEEVREHIPFLSPPFPFPPAPLLPSRRLPYPSLPSSFFRPSLLPLEAGHRS